MTLKLLYNYILNVLSYMKIKKQQISEKRCSGLYIINRSFRLITIYAFNHKIGNAAIKDNAEYEESAALLPVS